MRRPVCGGIFLKAGPVGVGRWNPAETGINGNRNIPRHNLRITGTWVLSQRPASSSPKYIVPIARSAVTGIVTTGTAPPSRQGGSPRSLHMSVRKGHLPTRRPSLAATVQTPMHPIAVHMRRTGNAGAKYRTKNPNGKNTTKRTTILVIRNASYLKRRRLQGCLKRPRTTNGRSPHQKFVRVKKCSFRLPACRNTLRRRTLGWAITFPSRSSLNRSDEML